MRASVCNISVSVLSFFLSFSFYLLISLSFCDRSFNFYFGSVSVAVPSLLFFFTLYWLSNIQFLLYPLLLQSAVIVSMSVLLMRFFWAFFIVDSYFFFLVVVVFWVWLHRAKMSIQREKKTLDDFNTLQMNGIGKEWMVS